MALEYKEHLDNRHIRTEHVSDNTVEKVTTEFVQILFNVDRKYHATILARVQEVLLKQGNEELEMARVALEKAELYVNSLNE